MEILLKAFTEMISGRIKKPFINEVFVIVQIYLIFY
jgi:hypothetical protein